MRTHSHTYIHTHTHTHTHTHIHTNRPIKNLKKSTATKQKQAKQTSKGGEKVQNKYINK